MSYEHGIRALSSPRTTGHHTGLARCAPAAVGGHTTAQLRWARMQPAALQQSTLHPVTNPSSQTTRTAKGKPVLSVGLLAQAREDPLGTQNSSRLLLAVDKPQQTAHAAAIVTTHHESPSFPGATASHVGLPYTHPHMPPSCCACRGWRTSTAGLHPTTQGGDAGWAGRRVVKHPPSADSRHPSARNTCSHTSR